MTTLPPSEIERIAKAADDKYGRHLGGTDMRSRSRQKAYEAGATDEALRAQFYKEQMEDAIRCVNQNADKCDLLDAKIAALEKENAELRTSLKEADTVISSFGSLLSLIEDAQFPTHKIELIGTSTEIILKAMNKYVLTLVNRVNDKESGLK